MKTKDEIRNFLSYAPGLDHTAELKFRYLAQGITNENYWINLNGKDYVLRINSPDTERLELNRKNEIKILEQLKPLQLAPEHICYNKQHNFFLTKWLYGRVWDNNDLEKPVNLNRLAQRLKQLHSLPCLHLPRINISNRFDQYRKMIAIRHGKLPMIEQRLLPVAINLLSATGLNLSPCLCHNDLLSANILTSTIDDTGRICFLDWEYAAVNDPLFELAVICRGNQLSSESQQYLLQAYLGETAGLHLREFNIWCWFYDYLSILWGLVILPEAIALPENLNQQFQQLMDNLP